VKGEKSGASPTFETWQKKGRKKRIPQTMCTAWVGTKDAELVNIIH